MTLRLLPFLFVAVAMLALSGCGDSYEWNQKVTVEVETPQGLRTGSSVMEMKYARLAEWQTLLSPKGYDFDLRGETVVVEVEPGRYLFALTLRQIYMVFQALHKRFGLPVAAYERLAPKIAAFRNTVVLEPKDYPMLVTFEDVDDPTSIKKVDPNDLAATFGEGVSLKTITLTITDDPVTMGRVREILPWLDTIGGGMLDGSNISSWSASNQLANSLTSWDFAKD